MEKIPDKKSKKTAAFKGNNGLSGIVQVMPCLIHAKTKIVGSVITRRPR